MLQHHHLGPGSQFQCCFCFSTDSWRKNYRENTDFDLGKSLIPNNYLNLTFPRKRTPRVSFRRVFCFFPTAGDRGRGRRISWLGLFMLTNYVAQDSEDEQIAQSVCIFRVHPR